MAITYSDEFLQPLCTAARETEAGDYVDDLGTFPDAWRNRLIRLRVYILSCLDAQAEPDDLYSAKLEDYRREWRDILPQARAASTDEAGDQRSAIAISWERG